MSSRIIIDGNAIYEVDEECLRKKKEKEQEEERPERKPHRSEQDDIDGDGRDDFGNARQAGPQIVGVERLSGVEQIQDRQADPAEQQDAGVGHRTHFAGDGECADVDRVRLAEEQGADAQKEQAKRGSTRKKHFHRTSYTVRASTLFLDDS